MCIFQRSGLCSASVLAEVVQLGRVVGAAAGPGTCLSGDLSRDDFTLAVILPTYTRALVHVPGPLSGMWKRSRVDTASWGQPPALAARMGGCLCQLPCRCCRFPMVAGPRCRERSVDSGRGSRGAGHGARAQPQGEEGAWQQDEVSVQLTLMYTTRLPYYLTPALFASVCLNGMLSALSETSSVRRSPTSTIWNTGKNLKESGVGTFENVRAPPGAFVLYHREP